MPSDRERFALLLRARHPLITISTSDEDRTIETIVGAALDNARQVITWTHVRGIYEGVFDTDHGALSGTEQPAAGLRWCWQEGANRVFVLLELLGKTNKVKVCRDWLVPAA